MNNILEIIVRVVTAVVGNRAIAALLAWLIGIGTAVFSTFLADQIRLLDLRTPERVIASDTDKTHKTIAAEIADLKSTADDSALGKLVESGNDERLYPETFSQLILVGDGTKITVADRIAYRAHMNAHLLHAKDAEETIANVFSRYVASINGEPPDITPYFRNLMNASAYNFNCLEALWKLKLEPETGIQYKDLRCQAPQLWDHRATHGDHKTPAAVFYILARNTSGLDSCLPTLRRYVQAVANALDAESQRRAATASSTADAVNAWGLTSIASRFTPKPNSGSTKYALSIDRDLVKTIKSDCATPPVYREDAPELAGSFPPPDAVTAYGNRLPELEPAQVPEVNLASNAAPKPDDQPGIWERIVHWFSR